MPCHLYSTPHTYSQVDKESTMKESQKLMQQSKRLKHSFLNIETALQEMIFTHQNDTLTLLMKGQHIVDSLIIHIPGADISSALQAALQDCLIQYQQQLSEHLQQLDTQFMEEDN